jgi:hypothetical protein
MRAARNFLILALIALLFVAAPGGDATLSVILTLLSIAFFAGIALFAYRLYHEHKFTVDSLSDRQRLILYGSVGLAFVNFTATARLFDQGGLGIMVWLALLGLCSYGVMWVYMSYRSYE